MAASRSSSLPSAVGVGQYWEVLMVRPDHPRLGLRPDGEPGARTIAGVRALFREHEIFRSYFLPALKLAEEQLEGDSADSSDERADPLLFASAWVATGEDRFAQAAVAGLGNGVITLTPLHHYYSNVWRFALAYDWLFGHPLMTDALKEQIEERIVAALHVEFMEADGDYPVVWHGRTQLANNLLVTTHALSVHPDREQFQERALPHYADAARALAMTQGWPEGPSYWIYNRAFPFALGADCFMTARGETSAEGIDLREMIRQAGYWQLYALAPDGTFVRHGDGAEGGLARGRGLWQSPQDYYARVSRDPRVIAAADYFRSWPGVKYHPGRYGWSAVLSYDPHLPMPKGYDPQRPADYLNAHLPRARVFGLDTLGEAYLIERWGDPEATWLSFKAGDVLAHHGHYSQGSFTIHRGSPLAVQSGVYADYFGPYRLGYYLQTVAANSILVHAPGEFSSFCRQRGDFDEVIGGQRMVIPTGSYVTSVSEWLRNQHSGRHYQAADIIAFESSPEAFDYLAADLTEAYNSTRYAEPGNPAKVSSVVRRFLYLRRPCAVVICDRVVTTDASYSTRWLLHSPGRPETGSERQVEGEPEDGILVTGDRWLTMRFEKGQLFHQVLLPEKAEIRKIGGPHYRHYIERASGGENLEPVDQRREEPDTCGRWRTEIVADEDRQEHLFLNVLWPRLADDSRPAEARLLRAEAPAMMLALEEWLFVFSPEGEINCSVFSYEAPPGAANHLVVDLRPRSAWRVETSEGAQLRFASKDGVLSFSAPPGPVRLTLSAPRNGSGHK